MALWKRISCDPELEQRMKQYYNEKGLAEIRIQFAPWIEEIAIANRNIVAGADPALIEQLANQFCDELRQKIIALANESPLKLKLAGIFTQVTQTPPVDLYSHVFTGIQQEIQALKEMPQNTYMYNTTPIPNNFNEMSMSPFVGGDGYHFDQSQYGLVSGIQSLAVEVEKIRSLIQPFIAEGIELNGYLNEFKAAGAMMTPELERQVEIFNSRKSGIAVELRRIITNYDRTQESVINELKNWQRNQALAGNGAQFHDNLDEIQRCIEMLVDLVCSILDTLACLHTCPLRLGDDQNLNLVEMLTHVRCAQEVLVLSAFIVDRQPPQVMKTHTRFAASVRWLIGPKLNIHLNNVTVDCIILSEAQAQRHSAQRIMGEASTSTPASSGEIVNNSCQMEYQQQKGEFSASFRNMQLKKIKRAEKRGTESVMDEKFALLFYTSSRVNDYMIRVWTLSLPVVVIVHGNQEPQSWATITWDNAFSKISREPFQVPERVPWASLSIALNVKFGSTTGRELTDENINFLHEKLFRNENGSQGDCITWAQFCKEPLPDRAFTFWDWFFAIMKLTKDHLLSIWKANLIVGFINKRRVTDVVLQNQPAGTFLLRFSDSELGGITVAFNDGQGNVLMLAPWTARDLNIRNLADRINDLQYLQYVYPDNKHKNEAFGEFFTQNMAEQTTSNGYVANTIRAHVPSIESGNGPIGTPQHNPQDMVVMSNAHFGMSDNLTLEEILYDS